MELVGSVGGLSLADVADEQLAAAAHSAAGRSARTVRGGAGSRLRHTVLALLAGRTLADHANPGEASLYVLRGRVRLASGGRARDGRAGDLLVVPPAVHRLEAVEDAVVLLTVVPA